MSATLTSVNTSLECDVDHAPPAIRVAGVSKAFHVYPNPTDRLRQALAWGRRQYYREFWALRGVSLEVRRGETLGIIGRNGSGKSTLLQIIAGTLRPTEGEVAVRGRVAALLELGSGFNPEFTGRENVYLNGGILGLQRREIEQRFDRIAAFAEIGDFMDLPVKTYSTGMVVRLAFAVQAQLSPDVLIVDEALAVGDEGFQRKCYAWLERFRDTGGTVLLVTHSLQQITQVCDRALLLEQGEAAAIGPPKAVGDVYQKLLYGTGAQVARLRSALRGVGGRLDLLPNLADALGESADGPVEPEPPPGEIEEVIRPPEARYGTGHAEILDAELCDEHGRKTSAVRCGQKCSWRYRVHFAAAAEGVRFGMMIKTVEGVEVAGLSSAHFGKVLERVTVGEDVLVEFRLTLNLAPGTYFLNAGVSAMHEGELTYLCRRVDVAAVRVLPCDARGMTGLAFTDPQFALRPTGGE